MKKKVLFRTVLAILLAFAATMFPVVQWLTDEWKNAEQIAELESSVAALDAAEVESLRNLAKWYNFQLEQGTGGLRAAYWNILDLGEGAMGILEVQPLNLRQIIYHDRQGKVGHDPNTPFPLGGRGRHTVLWLGEAYDWEQGMQVHIQCLGQRITYRVESIQVMPGLWSVERPTEAGQDLLTLVWDRGNTRTLVRCVRSQELTVRPNRLSPTPMVWVAVSASVLLVLPVLIRSVRGVQKVGNWGNTRENRRKSKLF